MSATAPVQAPELAPLRFSQLKWMAKSPAHAKWAIDHETPDTPQMRMGRLAHSCFLGSHVPVVYPGDRRGNAWKEFKAAHEGKDIVTEKEFQIASDMAAALHQHKEARRLLMGKREETIHFTISGRLCRATPDAYAGGADLPDLKSTSDASPEKFPWHALRMGYPAQLAFYKDGIIAAGKGNPSRLFIVAIEVKAPHAICVHQLTERAEDLGRRTYRLWLELFLNSERSDDWASYGPGVIEAPENADLLIEADEETEVD